jgi:hypothetical protein
MRAATPSPNKVPLGTTTAARPPSFDPRPGRLRQHISLFRGFDLRSEMVEGFDEEAAGAAGRVEDQRGTLPAARLNGSR